MRPVRRALMKARKEESELYAQASASSSRSRLARPSRASEGCALAQTEERTKGARHELVPHFSHGSGASATAINNMAENLRTVPINSELEEQIRAHHTKYGELERVFGTAFTAFREGIERTTIALPDGQLTHALRHTFASHFMMNGGNILTLQRILGHASLTMTMRYAHLAPEHLQEAKALNPIALLTVG